jgi:hypothetical protein
MNFLNAANNLMKRPAIQVTVSEMWLFGRPHLAYAVHLELPTLFARSGPSSCEVAIVQVAQIFIGVWEKC